jgi:hypothetical protein
LIRDLYDLNRDVRSESESAEEEFGVSSFFVFLGVGEVSEGVAEGIMEGLSESFSGLLGLEVVVLDVLEVEVVDLEAGGEDVILVDVLDEGLDTGLLDELLLAVGALGLGDVSADTGDQKMGESMFLI